MRIRFKRTRNIVLLSAALLSTVWSVASPPMAAALEAGDKAPDFTLPSTSGAKISLTQFRGEEAGAPRILRG